MTPNIDVAGWYKWTDAIRATGDVGTAASFYTTAERAGDDKNVALRRHDLRRLRHRHAPQDAEACGNGDNATVKFVIPMEAKLGFRYHQPPAVRSHRGTRRRCRGDRDDVAIRSRPTSSTSRPTSRGRTTRRSTRIQVRFPGDATGKGTLPVAGVAGGEIPPNADQKRGFKDVFGVRVGGDFNVLPDKLALRGGAFFETSAAEPAAPAHRLRGLDTLRPRARRHRTAVRFGGSDKTSALELMVGYGHVFFAEQSRTDPNASGAAALAGTSCNTVAHRDRRHRRLLPGREPALPDEVAGQPRHDHQLDNVINVGVAYRLNWREGPARSRAVLDATFRRRPAGHERSDSAPRSSSSAPALQG